MMYLEDNYALVSAEIRRTSIALSDLFHQNITNDDVSDFERTRGREGVHALPGGLRRAPRMAERGAYGRLPVDEYGPDPVNDFRRDVNYWALYDDLMEGDEDEDQDEEKGGGQRKM